MRERYGSHEMSELRARISAQANAASDGHLPQGMPESRRRDTRRTAFEARAFLYLMEDDAESGRQAVRMALDYLSSFTGTPRGGVRPVSRIANRAVFGAAMVYDWCYPLLSAEQKAEMVRQIKRLAAGTEYGWPPARMSFVTGHYGEEKNPCMLAAGIAVYDEAPSIYEVMAEHLYGGFASARNFFYPGHRHHQGSAYGLSRFTDEVMASFIITRMGAPNPCVADEGQVPYFFMYSRRPDGLFMVEGDDYGRSLRPGWYCGADFLHMLVAMYGDPYVQDEALRYGSPLPDSALSMLARSEAVESRPVEELPLTRHFGSPFGQMIARTGWDVGEGKQAGAAIAKMNVGEFMFGNHQHLDAGHFSLYYKGSLAIDSGVYEGTQGGYGSEHFLNYYQRSVAHNTILVLDPDEPKPRWWGRELESRDGGQFWPDGRRTEFATIDHVLEHGPRARVLGHEFGPDPVAPEYSYLKGDIAVAYHAPPPYPAKVVEAQRSFVFLNLKDHGHPAALVVFDRIAAREAAFRKTWLLHSINEPVVDNGVTTIVRTEGGYNGKLVNHTLLPEDGNRTIDKVGGPGREFWVDGRNYGQSCRRPGSHEPGAWRIELSPTKPAGTDLLLNVMQVMDAVGGPPPLTPELVRADVLVGAQIADRVVLFSRSGRPVRSEMVLELPGEQGELGVLITDVAAGRWRIEGPIDLDLEATPQGSALYFRGPPGCYRLAFSGPGRAPSGGPASPSRPSAEGIRGGLTPGA